MFASPFGIKTPSFDMDGMDVRVEMEVVLLFACLYLLVHPNDSNIGRLLINIYQNLHIIIPSLNET